MEQDRNEAADEMARTPLVPAAAIGRLLYPWAVELILACPPANDPGAPPPPP